MYCYVYNNRVELGPRTLPNTWTDPHTGQSYSNLSGFSDQQLLDIGWYPYVDNDMGSPGPYYNREYSDFTVRATDVTRTVTYTPWAIDDIKRDKNVQLEAQIVQYQANEFAINAKIAEYVQDDAKWFTDEQAALERITDTQEAMDFDTEKPIQLVLPNNYVGAQYVKQGVRLRDENVSATAAGLDPPWDDAAVDAFIAANRPAADDPSGATQAVDPDYKIRQGVAKVSEQFNRIVIFRKPNDNTNPALQTTYGMQMTNRQDSRDLYVFSYTNGTYLTWRKFEDKGNGVWALEATSAEWQYVPNDMGFIFSYGTNPAVEADYFTERVDFPAGVDQQNLLVAWDIDEVAERQARGNSGNAPGRNR